MTIKDLITVDDMVKALLIEREDGGKDAYIKLPVESLVGIANSINVLAGMKRNVLTKTEKDALSMMIEILGALPLWGVDK